MPYFFQGFFTRPASGVAEAALARWPMAGVVDISSPFTGIGLRMPDGDPKDPAQFIAVANFEDDFPPWTKNFPDVSFVYVRTECHGGDCDHCGGVYCNGMALFQASGDGALKRLLEHVGAELPDNEYFAPFERRYPWWPDE